MAKISVSSIWDSRKVISSIKGKGYYITRTKLISKVNMTKCRLYFSGYNLCNWSHLPKGFDPENPTNYIWAYPKTRSFTFGVNIGF